MMMILLKRNIHTNDDNNDKKENTLCDNTLENQSTNNVDEKDIATMMEPDDFNNNINKNVVYNTFNNNIDNINENVAHFDRLSVMCKSSFTSRPILTRLTIEEPILLHLIRKFVTMIIEVDNIS
jgi:hypothetical protein